MKDQLIKVDNYDITMTHTRTYQCKAWGEKEQKCKLEEKKIVVAKVNFLDCKGKNKMS